MLETTLVSLVAFSFCIEGANGFALDRIRTRQEKFVCSSLEVLDPVVNGKVVYIGINFVEDELVDRQHVQRGDDETELRSKKTVNEDVGHCSFCLVVERFSSDLKNMFVFLL